MIKSYWITDPRYYNLDKDKFLSYINNVSLNFDIDYICFRDKINSQTVVLEFAELLLDFFSDKKCIFSGDYKIASELGFYGVQLTSQQFLDIKNAKKKNLFTVISTHTEHEVKRATILGADAVLFSPIFFTPNKSKPKGVDVLKKIVLENKIKIFALGGIVNNTKVLACQEAGAFGFASIRYFS